MLKCGVGYRQGRYKEGEIKRNRDRRAERKTSIYVTTQQTMCCLNAGLVETIVDSRRNVASCITRDHVQARCGLLLPHSPWIRQYGQTLTKRKTK